MNLDHVYLVVVAGGEGRRLFPYSQRERPKAFLGGQGFLHDTVKRCQKALGNLSISHCHLALSNYTQGNLAISELNDLGISWREVFVTGQNGFANSAIQAVKQIQAIDPEAVTLITPCHWMANDEAALKAFSTPLLKAIQATANPARRQTIFLFGSPEKDISTAQRCRHLIFTKQAWLSIERPHLYNTAVSIATQRSKHLLINTGIILSKANRLLELISTLQHPDDMPSSEFFAALAQEATVIPLSDSCHWTDIGNWSALKEIFEDKTHNNAVIPNDGIIHENDNVNCVLCNNLDKTILQVFQMHERAVVLGGSPDRPILLVADLARAEEVRQLADLFHAQGGSFRRTEYAPPPGFINDSRLCKNLNIGVLTAIPCHIKVQNLSPKLMEVTVEP